MAAGDTAVYATGTGALFATENVCCGIGRSEGDGASWATPRAGA